VNKRLAVLVEHADSRATDRPEPERGETMSRAFRIPSLQSSRPKLRSLPVIVAVLAALVGVLGTGCRASVRVETTTGGGARSNPPSSGSEVVVTQPSQNPPHSGGEVVVTDGTGQGGRVVPGSSGSSGGVVVQPSQPSSSGGVVV
jgi:hypothetical protein